jgi:hypothetical protein
MKFLSTSIKSLGWPNFHCSQPAEGTSGSDMTNGDINHYSRDVSVFGGFQNLQFVAIITNMNKLTSLQLSVLSNVVNSPKSAAQLRAAQPGFYVMTYDKWQTIAERLSSEQYYEIQDLVSTGLLRMSAVRQPVASGFIRMEFYFKTATTEFKLAAVELDRQTVTVFA